jgi:hypothetical protein
VEDALKVSPDTLDPADKRDGLFADVGVVQRRCSLLGDEEGTGRRREEGGGTVMEEAVEGSEGIGDLAELDAASTGDVVAQVGELELDRVLYHDLVGRVWAVDSGDTVDLRGEE